MSAEGSVSLARDGHIARVTFDRPAARNALTFKMWDELDAICARLAGEEDLRAVVFRGAGGESFVAGSDIGQFASFESGADGIAYENAMNGHFRRLLDLPMPTVAVIEGWAVGGGLNIAACCDIRIAASGAKFGSPIARTIGNCVSMQSYARILDGFGEARTNRILMLAEFIGAEEALQAGFLTYLCDPDDLEARTEKVLSTLVDNAPLTLRVSKEAIGRIKSRDIDPADDLIGKVYGSEDFKTGVAAFTAKQKARWQGR